ncbi:MAG: SsrA-binding protein SmpB [Clostridia bacterium]|nr:SsrA-binding protein SmpB [Clostridia bacterium]
MKIIATNKKAYFNYFIEDTFEAGIMLTGSEVKSLRGGNININDSFVHVRDGEATIKNMHIAPYEKAAEFIPESRRTRKLLLNKAEILKLGSKASEQGYSIIPTKVYFKGEFIKIEIALCKGKKLYDKRDDLQKKDIKRETDREIKNLSAY